MVGKLPVRAQPKPAPTRGAHARHPAGPVSALTHRHRHRPRPSTTALRDTHSETASPTTANRRSPTRYTSARNRQPTRPTAPGRRRLTSISQGGTRCIKAISSSQSTEPMTKPNRARQPPGEWVT